jgi:hypothetical protein
MIIYEKNLIAGRKEIPNQDIIDGFLKSEYAKPAYIQSWPLLRGILAYLTKTGLFYDMGESQNDIEEIRQAILNKLYPRESEAVNA